jgi:hypothetical protein
MEEMATSEAPPRFAGSANRQIQFRAARHPAGVGDG